MQARALRLPGITRETLAPRVQEIVARRLSADTLTGPQEAALCVRILAERGVSCVDIARRCGVSVGAVYRWRDGFSEPSPQRRWAALATLTRGALQVQVRAHRLTGMQRVVRALADAGHGSVANVSRAAGMSPDLGARWLSGAKRPGIIATLRLRALVLRAALGQDYVALCDERLAAARATVNERNERFRRMNSRAAGNRGPHTVQTIAARAVPGVRSAEGTAEAEHAEP